MKLNKIIAHHRSSTNCSHYGRNSFHIFNLFAFQKLNAFSYWINSEFIFIQNGFEKNSLTNIAFSQFKRYLFCFFSPFLPFTLKVTILCPLSAAWAGSLCSGLMRKLPRGCWWQSHLFATVGFLYLVTKTLACVCSTRVLPMVSFGRMLK